MTKPSEDGMTSARPGPPRSLTAAEFKLFRDWIHTESGIYMEDSKADSLKLSLTERLSELSIGDYMIYFDKLSEDEDEFKELMNLVTINETSFFRFPAQFDALRDVVIPEIMEAADISKRRFQVWSAGCSTGEEPYTIAMTLLDSMLPAANVTPMVVGTDVSMRALMRAQQGAYPARSVATLDPEAVNRWFDTQGGKYYPKPDVRGLCSFHYQNLCRHPFANEYSQGWDVIFCRNVTIYFRPETTRKIVDMFYEALNPGGYLFIGHSETLASISQKFEAVERDGVFLYRKPRVPGRISVPGSPSWTLPKEPRASSAKSISPEPRPRAGAAGKPPVKPRPKAPARKHTQEPAEQHGKQDLLADAMAALESGNPTQAIERAKMSLENDPKLDDAKLIMAFAHADLGDFDTATKEVDEILGRSPLSAPAQYLLGVIRRERGDIEGAIAQFKRTFYVDKDFVLAHFALAAIYRQQGKTSDAAREYQNTVRSLEVKSDGQWTAFLGGFDVSTLQKAAERGFKESSAAASAAKGSGSRRR